jgi:hypothetical protein
MIDECEEEFVEVGGFLVGEFFESILQMIFRVMLQTIFE